MTDDGDVYGWGRNDNGQLSFPTSSQFHLSPTRLPLSADCHHVDRVLCGQEQVLIIKIMLSIC